MGARLLPPRHPGHPGEVATGKTKKKAKKRCVRCGDKFPAARPYEHCTKQDCVTAWKTERRSSMAINLIPKSGFTVVYRNDKHAASSRTTKG